MYPTEAEYYRYTLPTVPNVHSPIREESAVLHDATVTVCCDHRSRRDRSVIRVRLGFPTGVSRPRADFAVGAGARSLGVSPVVNVVETVPRVAGLQPIGTGLFVSGESQLSGRESGGRVLESLLVQVNSSTTCCATL